jgi:hypothetical protein
MLSLAVLVIGCITFVILGLVILASVPFFRLTVLNLFVFVLAAVPGAMVCFLLYGKLLFRDRLSESVFYGIFPVLLIGGIFFGALAVWLKLRFTSTRNINSRLLHHNS